MEQCWIVVILWWYTVTQCWVDGRWNRGSQTQVSSQCRCSMKHSDYDSVLGCCRWSTEYSDRLTAKLSDRVCGKLHWATLHFTNYRSLSCTIGYCYKSQDTVSYTALLQTTGHCAALPKVIVQQSSRVCGKLFSVVGVQCVTKDEHIIILIMYTATTQQSINIGI